MPEQLSLFGNLREPPRLEPVDPDGSVIAGMPDITLTLAHPKLARPLADIQLHEHENGRWMWATCHAAGGYKVGPKWGRFAATQREAMRHAAGELIDWCDRNEGRTGELSITPAQLREIRAWAEGML